MAILDAAFYVKDATFGAGGVFRDTAVRFCLSLCTIIVLLWVAISMYVSFYYAYMPTVHHSQPVFLEFSTDCVGKPEKGLCSFPEANVSLSKGDRILMRGQRYQVYLDLEMPQSPVNEKLGMFMITLKFLSHSEKTVATSSRSSMLHFKSGFLKAISTMFMSFPLMFGFSEEKQIVAVKMFENYVDDSYHPVTKINVAILAKHIEIYGASIRIEAEFSGFRYILFNWPISSALVCISANFIVACIVFFFAYHAFTPDHIETEADSTQIILDGQEQLYSEARRRDLRRSDQMIPRTPSPSTPHNTGTGMFVARTLYTRTKAPNAHSSFSNSSTAPALYNPPHRRLRSASFPPCRSEADDCQRSSSPNMAKTVRGAPCSTRGGGTQMHLGVPVGRGQGCSDGNDAECEGSRGYQSSPEVDTVQPLTYSELKDSNNDSSKDRTELNTSSANSNTGKTREFSKSLSFDSGVQRILPSYTIMNLKTSKDSKPREVTSTGDIVGQTERCVDSNGHLQDSLSLARQIPDGAPADVSQAGNASRQLTKAKSEEQCSSLDDEKTSLRKRSPNKTRSKFGSSFRKMIPRR